MKLKFWKIKLAIKLKFNYLFQIIYSITIYNILKIKKNKLEISKNKKVLIVGSGSSIDKINFAKVHNSTVILLNNSWQIYEKFSSKSNDIYFFCNSIGVLNSLSHELPKKLKKIFIFDLLNPNLVSLKLIFDKNTNVYQPDFYKISYKDKGKIFKTKEMQQQYGYFKFGFEKIKKRFFTEKKIYPLPYTCLYSAIAFFSKLNTKLIISIGIDNNNHTIENYSKYIDLSSYKKRYGNRKIIFNYRIRIIKNSIWNIKIYKELKKLNIDWCDINNTLETKHPNRINLENFDNFYAFNKIY